MTQLQDGLSAHSLMPKQLEGRLIVTVPEAGALLGLSRNSAYDAAKRGEIPTLKLGNRLVVPVPRLLELVGITLPDGAQNAGAIPCPV